MQQSKFIFLISSFLGVLSLADVGRNGDQRFIANSFSWDISVEPQKRLLTIYRGDPEENGELRGLRSGQQAQFRGKVHFVEYPAMKWNQLPKKLPDSLRAVLSTANSDQSCCWAIVGTKVIYYQHVDAEPEVNLVKTWHIPELQNLTGEEKIQRIGNVIKIESSNPVLNRTYVFNSNGSFVKRGEFPKVTTSKQSLDVKGTPIELTKAYPGPDRRSYKKLSDTQEVVFRKTPYVPPSAAVSVRIGGDASDLEHPSSDTTLLVRRGNIEVRYIRGSLYVSPVRGKGIKVFEDAYVGALHYGEFPESQIAKARDAGSRGNFVVPLPKQDILRFVVGNMVIFVNTKFKSEEWHSTSFVLKRLAGLSSGDILFFSDSVLNVFSLHPNASGSYTLWPESQGGAYSQVHFPAIESQPAGVAAPEVFVRQLEKRRDFPGALEEFKSHLHPLASDDVVVVQITAGKEPVITRGSGTAEAVEPSEHPSAQAEGSIIAKPLKTGIATKILDRPEIRARKVVVREEEIDLTEFILNNFNVIQEAPTFLPEEYLLRGDDLAKMATGLRMRQGGSVAITGRPGTGKTYLTDLFVSAVVHDATFADLRNRLMIRLSYGALTGGDGNIGPGERLVEALKMLSHLVPVTLIVEELHTLLGAGKHSKNPVGFFDQIKEELARGQIKIVGNTTDSEFNRYILPDPALADRFQVRIENKPIESIAEIRKILRSFMKTRYADRKIEVSDATLNTLIRIANRYNPVGSEPRKSIGLLDFALAWKLGRTSNLNPDSVVTLEAKELIPIASIYYRYDIADLSLQRLAKRVESLKTTLTEKLWGSEPTADLLRDYLMAQIFAQSTRVQDFKPNETQQPISILLFGASGSGKTTLAELLGPALGRGKTNRLSMTSFQNSSLVDRFKEQLAMILRVNPFAVVNIDQFELGAEDVKRVVGQILQSGRFEAMVGEQGSQRTLIDVDASNAIFFATSQLGEKEVSVLRENTTRAAYLQAARNSGEDRNLMAQFGLILPMPTASAAVSKAWLSKALGDLVDRAKKLKIEIGYDPQRLTEAVWKQAARFDDGQSKMGFSSNQDTGPSVSALQRELDALWIQITSKKVGLKGAGQVNVVTPKVLKAGELSYQVEAVAKLLGAGAWANKCETVFR